MEGIRFGFLFWSKWLTKHDAILYFLWHAACDIVFFAWGVGCCGWIFCTFSSLWSRYLRKNGGHVWPLIQVQVSGGSSQTRNLLCCMLFHTSLYLPADTMIPPKEKTACIKSSTVQSSLLWEVRSVENESKVSLTTKKSLSYVWLAFTGAVFGYYEAVSNRHLVPGETIPNFLLRGLMSVRRFGMLASLYLKRKKAS